jgi:hypothetical protein
MKSSWTHLITPSRNFVEVRWRSLFRSTSLGKQCTFYNAPPTSRKHSSYRSNFKISCFWAPCSWLEKPRNRMGARSGLYGRCSNGVPPIHFFQAEHRIHFRSRPMRFLGFSNHGKGAPRQEISKWPTVCITFSRSGWSVVRSASLAKGGTSKKRQSPHLYKVLTRRCESTNFANGPLYTVCIPSHTKNSINYADRKEHTNTIQPQFRTA